MQRWSGKKLFDKQHAAGWLLAAKRNLPRNQGNANTRSSLKTRSQQLAINILQWCTAAANCWSPPERHNTATQLTAVSFERTEGNQACRGNNWYTVLCNCNRPDENQNVQWPSRFGSIVLRRWGTFVWQKTAFSLCNCKSIAYATYTWNILNNLSYSKKWLYTLICLKKHDFIDYEKLQIRQIVLISVVPRQQYLLQHQRVRIQGDCAQLAEAEYRWKYAEFTVTWANLARLMEANALNMAFVVKEIRQTL